MTIRLALIVVAGLATLSGCAKQTFDVSYMRAVQELMLAYPKFDSKAPDNLYGPADKHPAYDSFYPTLDVRHEIVKHGSESRVVIENSSANYTRKTYLTVTRQEDNRVQAWTFSELTGKGLMMPMRDLNWETARLNEYAARLKLIEASNADAGPIDSEPQIKSPPPAKANTPLLPTAPKKR
ncbi:MAG: hypothetical protein LLG01_08055 [Planctomycetaceae bacterium]|nr:hypothetical protein [Planctomycetaceae bacterium]